MHAADVGRVRALARLVAQAYYTSREARGFPMADLTSPRLRALLGEEECSRIEALRTA